MVESIINKLIELFLRDEGILVLFFNFYVLIGNWSQVVGMKFIMREIRLKKSFVMIWVDIDREFYIFKVGDCLYLRFKEINYILEVLMMKVKELGYVLDISFVLQDLDEQEKEKFLYYYSEKLVIVFFIWKIFNKVICIRIYKNFRVCGDCYVWIKFVIKVVGKKIVVRDVKRFYYFKDGICFCRDYW